MSCADGDKRIAESEVVSEYLDLTYPEHSTRLFPTDPYKLSLVIHLPAHVPIKPDLDNVVDSH